MYIQIYLVATQLVFHLEQSHKQRYHLHMKKVNYNQLLQIVAIVSSFDIALLVSIVVYINSYLWQIVAVLILVFPVILISYHFVGVFYRKKGMIKDGKH